MWAGKTLGGWGRGWEQTHVTLTPPLFLHLLLFLIIFPLSSVMAHSTIWMPWARHQLRYPDTSKYLTCCKLQVLLKYNWTSPQRPPWGQKKSGHFREAAIEERLKQESMYGQSTKNSGRLLRCGEVAASGGSTVVIIASANANLFQATASLHPKSIPFWVERNDHWKYVSARRVKWLQLFLISYHFFPFMC